MKIAIALGTRPEIIKLSPIIRLCKNEKIPYSIIHSNQHYSKEMDKIFFEELELPKPKYNLEIGSGTHAQQTAKIMEKIESVLSEDLHDVIIVQGDTNTVMAAALAASKMGIKVAHVEAGLRSYDRTMPEEVNRIVTDHVSDYLFPPTPKSTKILKQEGIDSKKIFKVGNTIVDAVLENLKIAQKKVNILKKLSITGKNYFLLTAHRPSNVDDKQRLTNILTALARLVSQYNLPIIFPIHPRTKKQLDMFGLSLPAGVKETQPIGFLEMLQLEQNAKLILTDSGGIQEEACILKVPSITLRDNTERPETIEVGASMLAGNSIEKIVDYSNKMLHKETQWRNPFGTGNTAEKIINIIRKV